MKSVRWGLIGAGWIATKAIAPAMHMADNTIVQAVASRDARRSKALNPVTVHESYSALLEDPLVDAVYISLPNNLHCEWPVKALKAGKHVLCEKPFAMNVLEAQSMIDTAQEQGRLLVEAVASQWHPRMMRMAELVNSGNIGEINSIDSSFTFPASIEGNYRLSKAMGGGALFDIGIYPLHAIAALVGNQAEANIESCDVKLGPTGIDLTTKWLMHIHGLITAESLVSFEMPETQTFIVHGEKNSVELLGNQAFTSWQSPSALRFGVHIEEFGEADAHRIMIENFSRRVYGEDSWVLPLETSLWVQKVVDQLRNFGAGAPFL